MTITETSQEAFADAIRTVKTNVATMGTIGSGLQETENLIRNSEEMKMGVMVNVALLGVCMPSVVKAMEKAKGENPDVALETLMEGVHPFVHFLAETLLIGYRLGQQTLSEVQK